MGINDKLVNVMGLLLGKFVLIGDGEAVLEGGRETVPQGGRETVP